MTEAEAKTKWCPAGAGEDEGMSEIKILHIPEESDWECELFGCGREGIVFRPRKGHEPNWWWRWMQWLAFGNKWVRR